MRRFNPDESIPAGARGAAIALGNFDGVHLGHQGVIAATAAIAEERSLALAAAAFEPHPRRLFQPDAPPFRLQTRDQRARSLKALGVQLLYKIRFDRALSQMTDEEFCRLVLAERLGAKHVTVGFDFRFGRGRMGDVASLTRHGAALGFTVGEVAAISGAAGGIKVSSSAIRAAIADGDMDAATRMLGRPWAIEGEVIRGEARGRALGIPTANVALGDYLRPRLGVYAARVNIGDGVARPAAVNIGLNPTIAPLPEPMLEAHLLDFDGDLYGRTIEVALIAFLRAEEKYESVDAMMRQIVLDVEATRAILGSTCVTHHLAQINIARFVKPIDDPDNAEFISNLARVNAIAESEPGFVWRLVGDGENALDIRAFDDPQMAINMSVWTDIDALAAFAYRNTEHRAIMRRRHEWFEPMPVYMALWWIPIGHTPTPAEGKLKLEILAKLGPTPDAFTFKQPYPAPGVADARPVLDECA